MLALLIDLGWKSALVAAAALLANRAMRGRAAAERVLLLRIALAALLLLPALALLLPALDIALLPAPAPEPVPVDAEVMPAIPSADMAPTAVSEAPDPLGLLYAAGAALVLLHFAAGIVTLWRWTRAARPAADAVWTEAFARASAGLLRPVRLRVSSRVATPMSWGVAPAWVLIGPALERKPSEAEAVAAHEMAHVRRFDWPVLVASRLAIALYWFNPLVWLVDHALVREAEFAADDAAVRYVARADYAQTLLAVAMPGGRQPACGMAMGDSALARRIRRLLDERMPHPASRLLCAALLIGVPAAAVPLAAARIVPADPSAIAAPQDAARLQPAVSQSAPAAPLQVARVAAPARPVAVPAVRAPRVPAHAASARQPQPVSPAAGTAPAAKALPEFLRVSTPPIVESAPRVAPMVQPAPVLTPRPPRPSVERPPRPPLEGPSRAGLASQSGQPDPELASPQNTREEPQGASRLQRLRRWIEKLRGEAGRLEKAATYYPDSSDVRTAYIKAAGDARRQADALERDMRRLTPGQ